MLRKLKQLARDPVLRRWLAGRIAGTWSGGAPVRSAPPYLEGMIPLGPAAPTVNFRELPDARPENPLDITLAGKKFRIAPGGETAFFAKTFADTEQLLAMHRFAWLPFSQSDEVAAWLNVLYRAWAEKFGVPEEGWAWHPYTAAERLINLLDFAGKYGLPAPISDTLQLIARHGPVITDSLEYFGEGQTGNHLANNGRGLYLAGLKLGLEEWTGVGAKILLEEAPRIFAPSGILGEGSSHYHLLAARWYVECWLAAITDDRPEKTQLSEIAGRALAVLSLFNFSGRFPLIGDISPDCPPGDLAGLIAGENTGWLGRLNGEDRGSLARLRARLPPSNNDALAADGWLRRGVGKFSALWYMAPGGWAPMPGHGHRDYGSFELHHADTPVFVDPGRGSYGPIGDHDIAATAHNSLSIDGAGPYPVNKPYYSREFRADITGDDPSLSYSENEVSMTTNAFSRLKNVGSWERVWKFSDAKVVITDHIDGKGRHSIGRYFHTSLPVSYDGAEGDVRAGPFLIRTDGTPALVSSRYWPAYGKSLPSSKLTYMGKVSLPWSSAVTIENPD